MQMFFQLQKVDERTGLVTGRACQEVLDHSGEIFDYEKSKPHFEAWSGSISKATDGKSCGNVRAMHGKVSAGILKSIEFNDADKAIDVTALINDPVEKRKLLDGNYTGFSIGGTYVDKWEDPEHTGVMRYEAQPSEISIVDLPCVPTATFTAIKVDGSEELRKFHPQSGLSAGERETLGKLLKEQTELNKQAERDSFIALNAQIEEIAKLKDESVGDVLKSMSINVDVYIAAVQKWMDASEENTKALIAALTKSAAAGEGTSDTSTIRDVEPPAAVDPKLTARAEKLAKNVDAHRTLDTVRAAYGLEPVDKGLYDVAELANVLSWLKAITDCTASEAAWEGDNSRVPEELRASVKQLGSILLDMAAEEIAELVEGEPDVIALAAKVGELAKAKDAGLAAAYAELGKAIGIEPPAPPKPELSKVQRAVLDETTHALAKAREDLKASGEALAKANTRIAELEKLPAAKAPHLRVVGKAGDVADFGPADGAPSPEVVPVVVGGKVDPTATMIKAMHATRGQVSK